MQEDMNFLLKLEDMGDESHENESKRGGTKKKSKKHGEKHELMAPSDVMDDLVGDIGLDDNHPSLNHSS